VATVTWLDEQRHGAQRGPHSAEPASGLSSTADQEQRVVRQQHETIRQSPLRRVNEDLHSYYLLSYSHRIRIMTATFVGTSVNVGRPGLEVQYSQGLLALAGIIRFSGAGL